MKVRRWGAAALAGLTALLAGCSGGQDGYHTVTPETDAVVERTVEATGTVGYREEYSVIPVVSGKILSCSVEEGDAVTAGQALYVIDSGELEDQITQARLSLSSAQAAYDQAADACGDLQVPAHASGTVTEVYVHVGDYVNAGTAIAALVDSGSLTLTVPFSTADAASVVPGAAAVIRFTNQAETVSGTVERVYDSPTVFSGGRQGVYVELSFPNPGAVSSGMTAMASVGGVSCMESGTVSNATEQSIYATQSGQVADLPIHAGTAVTAGQTVMTIENASLTNAVTNAALSVESAQVSLAQLEDKLPDYTVTAPVDGVVLSRTFKTGDFASAATPLATLAQPDALCVHADIDELYINEGGGGQAVRVSFTTDQGEELVYEGTVRKKDETGVTSGGVTEYTVEIALSGAGQLRDGMNVSVSISVGRSEGCMAVPASAVSGGTVQVLRDGGPETVTVETGLTGGGYTEIRSGLSPDDQVILPS